MAKIGVAKQQGMISRVVEMLKSILVDQTKDNDEAVLAEVAEIKKQENSDRINFLMKFSDGQSMSNSKQMNKVEKVQTKQVKIEKMPEKEDEGREIGE